MVQKNKKEINIQAKSGLARLMAIENLVVNHDPSVSTAMFDIKNRIVTLPVLKDMNSYMYDAFIAHEISHALHTPEDGIKKSKGIVPHAYINVTEDARIEKLIQKRYPGTISDFYKFYRDLSSPERDFFGLKEKNLDEISLIDKINLYFKIGTVIQIPFRRAELPFIDMVENDITFDDALATALAIFEYDKAQNKAEDEDKNEDEPSGGDGKSGFTQKSFDENAEKELNISDSDKYEYKCGDIADSSGTYASCITPKEVIFTDELKEKYPVDGAYSKFIIDITPTINMMINQFNMKKSAEDFAKTEISKTGIIDMKSISNYKTQNDIFLRSEVLPDSKNHGMVMFIDWSGSMSGEIAATVKQLIILTEFCTKVGIPFEVYGFTTGTGSAPRRNVNVKSTEVFSEQECSLFNILSSKTNIKEYREMSAALYSSTKSGKCSTIQQMGMTPLTHLAFISEHIVRDFQKTYNIEKTSLILLSDGAPSDSIKNSKKNIVMRDPDTGKNYSFKMGEYTNVSFHGIFGYVKDKLKLSSLIGIFISSSLENYHKELLDPAGNTKRSTNDIQTEFKNEKYTHFDGGKNFDKFFVVDINNFSMDTTNYIKNVDGNSTENVRNKAFEQELTKRSKTMIFMKIFVDLIA